MIIFPAQLPCALREGYGLQTQSPLQRTELDSGRTRQRRRFTNVPTVVSVSWILKTKEAQVFEGFFQWTIHDGADWFEVPLKTPTGLHLYEARFVDMYDGPTLAGPGLWRVNAQLELRERPTINQSWAEFPAFIMGSDIIDLAVNREWPAA